MSSQATSYPFIIGGFRECSLHAQERRVGEGGVVMTMSEGMIEERGSSNDCDEEGVGAWRDKMTRTTV